MDELKDIKTNPEQEGELADDDVKDAAGGKFPIFSGLVEKDGPFKPI